MKKLLPFFILIFALSVFAQNPNDPVIRIVEVTSYNAANKPRSLNIYGSNFGNSVSALSVTLAGTPLNGVVLNSVPNTQIISATIPSGNWLPGTYLLKVTVGNNKSSTSDVTFGLQGPKGETGATRATRATGAVGPQGLRGMPGQSALNLVLVDSLGKEIGTFTGAGLLRQIGTEFFAIGADRSGFYKKTQVSVFYESKDCSGKPYYNTAHTSPDALFKGIFFIGIKHIQLDQVLLKKIIPHVKFIQDL